jgi:RNase P/RNase MRP subunit p30
VVEYNGVLIILRSNIWTSLPIFGRSFPAKLRHQWVRKEMEVIIVWKYQRGNQKNEHKRLSNITLRHNSDSIDAYHFTVTVGSSTMSKFECETTPSL